MSSGRDGDVDLIDKDSFVEREKYNQQENVDRVKIGNCGQEFCKWFLWWTMQVKRNGDIQSEKYFKDVDNGVKKLKIIWSKKIVL